MKTFLYRNQDIHMLKVFPFSKESFAVPAPNPPFGAVSWGKLCLHV